MRAIWTHEIGTNEGAAAAGLRRRHKPREVLVSQMPKRSCQGNAKPYRTLISGYIPRVGETTRIQQMSAGPPCS